MSISIIQRYGFDFSFNPYACKECPGKCCSGESGNIWVTQYEMRLISSFLRINLIDCIQKYFTTHNNRITNKERLTESGYECIFLKGSQKNCSIYEVRPSQCREYPFWDYFRKHKELIINECPGITENNQ